MNEDRYTRVVVISLLLFAGPLSAHHSVGVFETSTPIWVKGTVVRYNWSNPHSAIIVEQKLDNGRTVRWAMESSVPIRGLVARGFTDDSFKPGDAIQVCGYAPKKVYNPHLPIAEADSSSKSPHWLQGADRIITGRYLLTRDGPRVNWSTYGPLEPCMNVEELQAHSH